MEVHSHKARPVLLHFKTYKLTEGIKESMTSGANPFIWHLIVEKIYLKLLLAMHKAPGEESAAPPR